MKKFFSLISLMIFCFIFLPWTIYGLTITGKVQTLPITLQGPTPVSGATVKVNGTTITTTSGADGSFTLTLHDNSIYILSATKEGYVKSYTIITGGSGNVEQEIFILTETALNNFYNQAGVTRNTLKGTLLVGTNNISTPDNPTIWGATGIIKDLNGNDAAEKIMYFKIDGTMVSSPDPTVNSGTGGFIGFNVSTGPVMVSAEKTGMNFIWRPVFIFANSLVAGTSSTDTILSTDTVGTIYGTLQDENNNLVSDATVDFCGTGIVGTTGSNGGFSLSNVPIFSLGLLKFSKTNYKDTYTFVLFDDATERDTYMIISSQYAQDIATQASVTLDTNKGYMTGMMCDQRDNPVKLADLAIYNENGTKNTTKIYYMDSNSEGIDTSLTASSDSGVFVFFNFDPNEPIYLKFTKEGSESQMSLGIVFPDSISFSRFYIDLEIGHISVSSGKSNPSAGLVAAGTNNVKMLHIKLEETTNSESVSLKDTITITGSGTGNEANDISSVKLYLSDEDGNLSTLLAQGTYSADNGTVTFSPEIDVPRGGNLYLMVTYDIKNATSPGRTFKVSLLNNSDIIGHGNTTNMEVSVEGAPIEGNTMTIQTTGAPDISASPTSINFGQVTVDTTSSETTITVSNNGDQNLTVGEITITDTENFSIIHDNVSNRTLPPGASATFGVVFAPKSTGNKVATITIPSNDPDGDVTINLSGEGIGGTASTSSGGGCFIATACFGSPLSKYVIILEKFRDNYLIKNKFGKIFVKWYYKYGKLGAMFIENYKLAKLATRTMLYPIILFVYLFLKGILFYVIIGFVGVFLSIKFRKRYGKF